MSFKGFSILALAAILYRGADHFSNFGSGSSKENFCEIILKSGNWPRRRCDLKVFLF